jgi:hypothetical protein
MSDGEDLILIFMKGLALMPYKPSDMLFPCFFIRQFCFSLKKVFLYPEFYNFMDQI